MNLLSPLLFVSYSRLDFEFAEKLVNELRGSGFRVFLDTSSIDPGDNFVAKLSKEVNKSTAIIPIITENYASSRWAQAELYQGLTAKKIVIPIVTRNGSMSDIDQPLQRLLRDTQYFEINDDHLSQESISQLKDRLVVTRRRHRKLVVRNASIGAAGLLMFILMAGWFLSNSNRLQHESIRAATIDQIKGSNKVLQSERINLLGSAITGDSIALGEIISLSHDPFQADTARFNALMLASGLQQGRDSYRWYIKGLDLNHVTLGDVAFVKTSFIGGNWSDANFTESVFANVFWSEEPSFTMSNSSFNRVQFLGSEIESVTAIGVSFINTKFVGSTIDTTNFSKVRFVTESPKTEGNPIITPYSTSFEKSVLISRREPPQEGVLDLTLTGDDIVFDEVFFVDCRLEGWFRPEWFRGSFFERCELPDSLSKESLVEAGNIVH